MHEISNEDFQQYFADSQDFYRREFPECCAVAFYRRDDNEFIAISEANKYYAKYMYWRVQ